jgi:hypothetical protein
MTGKLRQASEVRGIKRRDEKKLDEALVLIPEGERAEWINERKGLQTIQKGFQNYS